MKKYLFFMIFALFLTPACLLLARTSFISFSALRSAVITRSMPSSNLFSRLALNSSSIVPINVTSSSLINKAGTSFPANSTLSITISSDPLARNLTTCGSSATGTSSSMTRRPETTRMPALTSCRANGTTSLSSRTWPPRITF